jgi:hypothetical protein
MTCLSPSPNPSRQGRGEYLLYGFSDGLDDLRTSPLTLNEGSSYSGSENELNAFKEIFFYCKENDSWPNSKERF